MMCNRVVEEAAGGRCLCGVCAARRKAESAAFDREESIRALAMESFHVEGECEVDDNAVVSEGEDNGAYVQVWAWVSFDGTALDKDGDK